MNTTQIQEVVARGYERGLLGVAVRAAPQPMKLKPLELKVNEVRFLSVSLSGQEFLMTRESALELARGILEVTESRSDPSSAIRARTAEVFNVSIPDLDSDSRREAVVWPRWVAMYLIRKLIRGQSLESIGLKFGGFDHGTVLHGCRRVDSRMSVDARFGGQVLEIERLVREQWETKE